MRRVAVLEGGTYFHDFSICDPKVAHLIDRSVYLRDMRSEDLEGMDVLILMSRLNPDLLDEKKEMILAFRRGGGQLIVLADNHVEDWMEDVRHVSTEVNFWWWLEPNADSGLQIEAPHHPIFRYMDAKAVVWHYHGMFVCPDEAVSIVRCREGGSIFYEQPDGTLLTTLDPDFHHGSFFMPSSTLFWHGLLNYSAYYDSDQEVLCP